MNNIQYITYVENARRGSFADFVSAVATEDQTVAIIRRIEENGDKFVGITTKNAKKDEGVLSADEQKWKAFFRDHAFSGPEEARIWADAVSLLTNCNVHRFIVMTPTRQTKFPTHICIVPTGNLNNHNYPMGTPIINTSSGFRFYQMNGERGNDMSFEMSDWRLASHGEVVDSVLRYMFHGAIPAENFVVNLLR